MKLQHKAVIELEFQLDFFKKYNSSDWIHSFCNLKHMKCMHFTHNWSGDSCPHSQDTGLSCAAGQGRIRIAIFNSVGTLALHSLLALPLPFPRATDLALGPLPAARVTFISLLLLDSTSFPFHTLGCDWAEVDEVVCAYQPCTRVTSRWSGSPEKQTSYGKQKPLFSQECRRFPHLCARAICVSS